jgi:hypothetical protein
MGGVEGYCEGKGHVSIRIPIWGSGRVEESRNSRTHTHVLCFDNLALYVGISWLLPKINRSGSYVVPQDHY